MFTATIPRDLREACMCKSFGSSLIGPALQWFTNLPNNSISSFAQLTDTFVEQFTSSKKLEKLSGDLYRVQQRRSEPLRDYVSRFNREKVIIPFYYQETAVDAFRKGLLPDGELYKELTKFNCTSMEDVLARAWVQIRWEEDELHRTKRPAHDGRSEERRPKRQFQPPDRRTNSRHLDSYSAPTRNFAREARRPLGHQATKSDDWPAAPVDQYRIPEYNLNVEPVEVIAIMKNMGNAVRWPRQPDRSNPKWDNTQWCEYHADHGHTTANYVSLRLEVAELLKRGHLLDLLTNKGKKTIAKRDNHVEEPREPTPERVINVITGGSEISGISYSAARRHARVFVNPETCSSQPPAGDYTDQVISFVDNEATALINPHHDALVISLLVANCKIKRILVDNGSSTNVLFLNALKEMKIDESNIRRCTTVLVGFSRE
ncbi:hypothetical protein UlMin_013707 [Ulmus minor]